MTSKDNKDKNRRKTSLNPLKHEVIPPANLMFLSTKYYKYSVVDGSICCKLFMMRFYSFVVECFPYNIAANVITLLGSLACLVTAFFITYFHFFQTDAELGFNQMKGEWLFDEESIPRWIWLSASIGLFVYQVFDAIDGKQARRQGNTGPVGEVLDHGCDALICPLLQICVCLAVRYSSDQSLIHCLAISSGVFFTLFEQYITGTLNLGGAINAPTEGNMIVVLIFFLNYFIGPQWWASDIIGPINLVGPNGFINFGPSVNVNISKPRDIWLILTVAAVPHSIFLNLLRIYRSPTRSGPVSKISSWLPHVLLITLFTAVFTPWHSLRLQFPFVLETILGLLTSYTATRLTICRLGQTPYRWLSKPFLVLTLFFSLAGMMKMFTTEAPQIDNINAAVGRLGVLLVIFMVLSYIHMVLATCWQFKTFLGVNLLSLTSSQIKALKEKGLLKQK